jgi:hypothetical protein
MNRLSIALAGLLVAASLGSCGGDDNETGNQALAEPNGAVTQSDLPDGQESSGATPQSTGDEGGKRVDEGAPQSAPQSTSGDGFDRPPFNSRNATIATTLETYFEASASGDWEGVCSTLASSLRSEAQQLGATPGKFHGKDCAEILAASTARQGKEAGRARASLVKTEIIGVKYEGDRAVVRCRRPGYPICTIPMQREGDGWKVASLLCSA